MVATNILYVYALWCLHRFVFEHLQNMNLQYCFVVLSFVLVICDHIELTSKYIPYRPQSYRNESCAKLLEIPSNHYFSSKKPGNSIHHTHIRSFILALKSLRVKSCRPIEKYIFIILLANSFDIETNPGPRQPRWPCGTCGKAVAWKQKALCCDGCDVWYHINCQGMTSNVYQFMDASNVSWECIQCGLPNFSTGLFNYSDIETSNSFSNLTNQSVLSSPGEPTAKSSPIPKSHRQIPIKRREPIKILTINFQSIKNKKEDLLEIIHSVKPNIIIGTETWLDKTIPSHEYLPKELYNV